MDYIGEYYWGYDGEILGVYRLWLRCCLDLLGLDMRTTPLAHMCQGLKDIMLSNNLVP